MTVSLPWNALATVETSTATSVQQMGIFLLLDLAKQGEINPWDVQVIEAIDRFLSQTMPMSETAQIEREAALSQSGQAFLCASMLVWLKAESLLRQPSLEEEFPEFIEEEQESDGKNDGRVVPMNLERQLRRRAVAQPPQKRRVSLQELLEQLQLIAKAMEENPRRRSHRLLSNKSRAQTVKAITHLAHQENLSEMAVILERFLAAHWHQIAQEQEWLEFEKLLSLLPAAELPAESGTWAMSASSGNEPAPKSNDKVGIFWALLLLCAQSKVELSQEEFYQDLKIRALPEGL